MYWAHIPATWDFSMTPKQRWKLQESMRRYVRRYGEPKKFFTGEIGRVDGIRIIRSK